MIYFPFTVSKLSDSNYTRLLLRYTNVYKILNTVTNNVNFCSQVYFHICAIANIMHRGQVVEDIVRKSGFPLSKIAERLKISRRTLYQWFTYPELSIEKIARIGRIINHDFSEELTEMSIFVNEDEHKYGRAMSGDYKKILSERDEYLKLYHDLVEKHTKVLEELVELQKEVTSLKLKAKGK